jgi:hypothetical protein
MSETRYLNELEGRLAFVIMQYSCTPWNLFEVIRKRLKDKGYVAVRADHVPGAGDRMNTMHLWTMINRADLVIVDMSSLNVNVYIELGTAMAWENSSEAHRPRVAVIGDRKAESNKPFDVKDLKFHPYDIHPGNPGKTARSIVAAIDEAVTNPWNLGTQDPKGIPVRDHRPYSDEFLWKLLEKLPREVAGLLDDPAASLLTSLYILQLGRLVGEELAATIGFPPLAGIEEGDQGRISIDPGMIEALPAQLLGELGDDAKKSCRLLLDSLLRILRERDEKRIGDSTDLENLLPTDRRLTFVGALIKKHSARSAAQVRSISETMADIASASASAPSAGMDFGDDWRRGIVAIHRLTRLAVRPATPNDIMTIQRIQSRASEYPLDAVRSQWRAARPRDVFEREAKELSRRHIQGISTLGGALFLGHSVGLLNSAEPGSPYALAGETLCSLALPGQRIDISRGNDLLAYREGLLSLAAEGDFVFALEHPFHFRVLLEILSDENRRYPAEAVIGFQSLRTVWQGKVWDSFVWSRDQLPAVNNITRTVDREGERRDVAFIQNYISFGRTPHTSSFVRLEYDADEVHLAARRWWPDVFGSPAAAGGRAARGIVNVPNAVAESRLATARQRTMGRIWRNQAEPGDLRWLRGELVRWDGVTMDQEALAGLVWDSSRWLGLDFPTLVLAEVHTGTWILQSLRRHRRAIRRALSEHPLDASAVGDMVLMGKKRDQLTAVLGVLARFTAEYVSDEDDSIGNLCRAVEAVGSAGGEWRVVTEKMLGYLAAAREGLQDELRAVELELAGP